MRPSKMAVLIEKSSTWPSAPPSTVTTTERPPRTSFNCSALSVTSSWAASAPRGRSLMMTVDFMAILLEVNGRARRSARSCFCKGYANLHAIKSQSATRPPMPGQARMRIARPLIAKRDDAKPAARCMDTADRTHPNCWAACTRNTARHARVPKRGAATTKAARVDDACRCTALINANLAAPCIARRRHFHDGLMRRRKAGRIFADASRGRHERRGARQPRPNACAADNGGHRLTVEVDVVCEIVDEKLGHDVFAAKVERLAGAMIRRALAGVVRCAEVSSHYEYRKSVFSLPARFTNARLVPDLFKVPNKSYGAFMDK